MDRFRTVRSFVRNRTGIFLAALFTLIAGMQMRVSAAADQAASEPNLVVMTFNIRYGTANDGENNWVNRKDLACDVLGRHNPDVVGLQEALRSQIDDIRAALPQYAEIGGGRDDGRTKGEYSAILYRADRLGLTDSGTFWLSDTPDVPGSITWGNACTRICTWGRFIRKDTGEAFYFFNTHLDHMSQYSRDRAAILLAQRIRDRVHPDPVLLTGDFNAGEDNSVVQYFKGQRELSVANNGLSKNPVVLVDTFRVLNPDAKEVGTFHGFKGGVSAAKIDYILAQPATKVLRTEILRDNKDNRYPSDHFPVIAVVALPATQAK
ncbi:MAG: endonuclease/exonuclease/phosphatase family protein [Phycisphaerales bacterium]